MSLRLHLFQDVFSGFCSKFRNHFVTTIRKHGNKAAKALGSDQVILAEEGAEWRELVMEGQLYVDKVADTQSG